MKLYSARPLFVSACPVHTPVCTPMCGMPLSQSDRRIPSLFHSVYNNEGNHHEKYERGRAVKASRIIKEYLTETLVIFYDDIPCLFFRHIFIFYTHSLYIVREDYGDSFILVLYKHPCLSFFFTDGQRDYCTFLYKGMYEKYLIIKSSGP